MGILVRRSVGCIWNQYFSTQLPTLIVMHIFSHRQIRMPISINSSMGVALPPRQLLPPERLDPQASSKKKIVSYI